MLAETYADADMTLLPVIADPLPTIEETDTELISYIKPSEGDPVTQYKALL